jgi:hypothetical protein
MQTSRKCGVGKVSILPADAARSNHTYQSGRRKAIRMIAL